MASSASGEWQELKLFLGVLFGLGQDDSLGPRLSGDAGPKPRDIWRLRSHQEFGVSGDGVQ